MVLVSINIPLQTLFVCVCVGGGGGGGEEAGYTTVFKLSVRVSARDAVFSNTLKTQ